MQQSFNEVACSLTMTNLFQKLSDKLAEEAKILLKKSYPIISHNQLLKIVKQSSIDLDEEELIQVFYDLDKM